MTTRRYRFERESDLRQRYSKRQDAAWELIQLLDSVQEAAAYVSDKARKMSDDVYGMQSGRRFDSDKLVDDLLDLQQRVRRYLSREQMEGLSALMGDLHKESR